MKNNGMTLVELIIATTILGIVVLVVSAILMYTLKTTTQTDLQTKAHESTRQAMYIIEMKLLQCNQVLTASNTEIVYVADLDTYSGYDGNADFDGDGKVNKSDPDIDNDATLIVPPTAQWTVGYNLKDDDDDNDGNYDMIWKLYLTSDGKLYSDFQYNEEGWGNHRELVLANISSTTVFDYSGSKNDLLSIGGAGIDSDSNGIITQEEMDIAGNNNGTLDLQEERDYIVMIKTHVEVDKNNDSKPDFKTDTEILPPLLYLKRRPM